MIKTLFVCLIASAAHAATMYDVTDLGSLGGSTVALGINAGSQVTGYSWTGSAYRAFLWNAGVMRDLGTLGGSHSFGNAINASGQVTGYSLTSGGTDHAFLWNGTSMADLGASAGNSSYGLGINDAGYVTGLHGSHAFLWNGSMSDLGTLGGDYSQGDAVNNAGHVTGWSQRTDGASHAFLWNGAAMQDLGTLGGISSSGRDLNDSGQVTGYAATAAGYHHAFLWNGATMQDLGTLGGAHSYGFSINSLGLVTGNSGIANESSHAFLWDGSAMLDLNNFLNSNPGTQLYSAYGINDAGQIIANGYNGHAYLLTPDAGVPEAGTVLLIGAGLVAIGLWRRRAIASAAVLAVSISAQAATINVINNGTFEAGNLAGWTAASQSYSNTTGSCHNGFAAQANAAGCISGDSPASGAYAVYTSTSFPSISNDVGQWSDTLMQNFFVPTGTITSATVEWADTAIWSGTGGFRGVDVVTSLYQGSTFLAASNYTIMNPGGNGALPWTSQSWDVTSVFSAHQGQTLTLHLATYAFYDTRSVWESRSTAFQAGFDNVSLNIEQPDPVPEPSSFVLLAAGLLLLPWLRRALQVRDGSPSAGGRRALFVVLLVCSYEWMATFYLRIRRPAEAERYLKQGSEHAREPLDHALPRWSATVVGGRSSAAGLPILEG